MEEDMAGNFAHLFSAYTDEQLLELAAQRDTLLDAGKAALDEEMKRRGYDPHELLMPNAEVPPPANQGELKVNWISRVFLQAQHWQLFLMFFCLYFFGFMAAFMSPSDGTTRT